MSTYVQPYNNVWLLVYHLLKFIAFMICADKVNDRVETKQIHCYGDFGVQVGQKYIETNTLSS